jgi:hypothetical protein
MGLTLHLVLFTVAIASPFGVMVSLKQLTAVQFMWTE